MEFVDVNILDTNSYNNKLNRAEVREQAKHDWNWADGTQLSVKWLASYTRKARLATFHGDFESAIRFLV